MVKSYKGVPRRLNNKRELQRRTKQLVEAIRHAHRQSSGGRDLVRIVFKVLLFIEL